MKRSNGKTQVQQVMKIDKYMNREKIADLWNKVRRLQIDTSEIAVKLQDLENELDYELSKLPTKEETF